MSEIFVKNPHSILQALRLRPKEILEITAPRSKSGEQTDGVWDEILTLAEKSRVRVKEAGSGGPSKHAKSQVNMGRESGHGAMIKPKAQVSLERLFQGIDASTKGVWLALDCLQDPQNLGAIFRSAAFFGARGIIMTTERSAPMTATVYDISSGGVEAVPFVQAINLKQALEKAKDAGLWILGTSEHAKEPLKKVAKDRPWLIVVGNEEKGMRRLTEESCDVICAIPPAKDFVTSLNVSVATGILLSHLT